MPPGTVIPELAYDDVGEAAHWLSRTFGFKERLSIGDHRFQLVFGEAAIVAVRSSEGSRSGQGIASHSVMVRVPDVDRHYQHARERGARILHPPVTFPFGERQYTVEDPGGHMWTFSQSVADVDPRDWGGELF
jgi:uncharacterized glyoxalase superfamily protein PhnB